MEIHDSFLTSEKVYISTCARPICFSEGQDGWIWGIGSSFVFNYDGCVYAITAKHVIENQKVNPTHTRILMPETNVALPIKGAIVIEFDTHDNKEEVEDFILFQIDYQQFVKESDKDLYFWDFKHRAYPASKLSIGYEILVAGFPSTEDRYDYDSKRINDLLLLRSGNINKSILGSDMYTLEGIPSEYDFNGISGSPVFCRINEYMFFIGLVTRGTASSGKLHFIGSEIIYRALKILEKKSE